MQRLINFAKNWLPPVISNQLRIMRRDNIIFEGGFDGWEDVSKHSTGYDAETILSKVLEATLKVKHGDAVFERDSVLFNEHDYVWPVTAGLAWIAAINSGRINVLDFGGSLGSSYFQNKKLLDELNCVRWNVVEQSHYVQAGLMHIQDEIIRFYSSVEECLKDNGPDVILLSSVLQYLRHPSEVFTELSRTSAKFLIIDRIPLSEQICDEVLMQRVPSRIYDASYPMWVFGKSVFFELAEQWWEKVASWENKDASNYIKVNFGLEFKGMILEKKPEFHKLR